MPFGNSIQRKILWNAGKSAVLQSQRDCVIQPRVTRNELPWVACRIGFQPQRGYGGSARSAATPLGLVAGSVNLSKVARSSQPWALRRNPVGIHLRSL